MADHSANETKDVVMDEKKQKTAAETAHGHSHEHTEGHAEIVALGCFTVGGATFSIDREGEVEAGATTEFGVERVAGAEVKPTSAWLANPDGTKLCDVVTAEDHMAHWHFNVEPLMPIKKSKFVLKVGEEEAVIDWRRGAAPKNGGILSVLKAPSVPDACFFLELKLHGDAGDLELWLYDAFMPGSLFSPKGGKPAPLDVPPSTVLNLSFPSHGGKTITMAVRDTDKNEDEEGVATMRPSGTTYFIFPGESGQDPAWLIGETVTSWRGTVTVAFEAEGKAYVADPFVLVPHDAL